MSTLKAAFIGFMPRGISLDEQFDVLKEYAAIGYRGVEVGNFLLNGDVQENRKRLEEIGLSPIDYSIRKPDVSDVPEIVKNARAIGVDKAVSFMGCVGAYRFGGRELPPDYDEVMRELADYEAVAKELHKEGITLMFHNHDAEFKSYYNGKPAFIHMLENTEYLKFELDVGWVTYGGFDPVRVLKYTGDRLAAMHVKDFQRGNVAHPNEKKDPAKYVNPMPNFSMPGTGLLPLQDCLETAIQLGLDYAIVEQDFMNHLSQKETLTGAFLNMKESGFVE